MNKLTKIYNALESHFGDLKWWPADTDFEVIIGTILTQNTAWRNVEKAIESLRDNGLLTPTAILRTNNVRLSQIIRSAGYHRIKAGRLKEICRFVLAECNGNLLKLKSGETKKLREKLLGVKGVGPETADSILLYALGKPVFVVDTYAKRIFLRHGLVLENASYNEVQDFVLKCFPLKKKVLNQFHALLVETAKNFCKKRNPLCEKCPLKKFVVHKESL